MSKITIKCDDCFATTTKIWETIQFAINVLYFYAQWNEFSWLGSFKLNSFSFNYLVSSVKFSKIQNIRNS